MEKTIGKSKGGNTTKIPLLADAHENPIDFKVTPGSVPSVTFCIHVFNISEAENIISDKGYDAQYLREPILAKGSEPHISLKSSSNKTHVAFAKDNYKHRHLVENLFAKLKHCDSL